MSLNVTNSRILIVDDTLKNIQVLGAILKREGYKLNVARDGLQALKATETVLPDLILLDVMMPELDGYETCKRMKASERLQDIPIIFLTAKTETDDIIRGFEVGGIDYVTKPFNSTELLARITTHLTIHHLQKKLQNHNRELTLELQKNQVLFREAYDRINVALLGNSDRVCQLKEAISTYSTATTPLLLVGPSGAGDEAVARAIHASSPRKDNIFIHVNCLQIQQQQHSDLFVIPNESTEKHSEIKSSLIDLADDGTIYLEGINYIPATMQLQLANQLKEICNSKPSRGELTHSPRFIVYMNCDLSRAINEGLVHPELTNQLGQHILPIPSLLERRGDIPNLVNFFIKKHAKRLGKNIEGVSDDSMTHMKAYSWPGNIRELESVIERSISASTSPTLEISDELLIEGARVGKYRLLRKIGEGGMGEVWGAKHQLLTRPAAIKLIRIGTNPEDKKSKVALQRFEREAKATANLQSPNTVRLYDYGVSDEGAFYIVMEQLNGMDINTMIRKFGAMKAERVVYFLLQACRSLMEAHSLGLLHRDIKSQNLFICRLGAEYDVLKVLDFGMVKNLDPSEDDLELTNPNEIPGTATTVAPELLNQEGSDNRADIYSLGCVAYRMLTGKAVFQTTSVTQMLLNHVSVIPKPPSAMNSLRIPKGLDKTVMACLEKNPENRPESADILWENLHEIRFKEAWNQDRAKKWWRSFSPSLCEDDYSNLDH